MVGVQVYFAEASRVVTTGDNLVCMEYWLIDPFKCMLIRSINVRVNLH